MNVDAAVQNFRRATEHCDNLIKVHRASGGPDRGRRSTESSLNRAVVVLAVASWQAVIQDYTRACLESGTPGPASPISKQTYDVIAGRVRKEIENFSTANARTRGRCCWVWDSIRARPGHGLSPPAPARDP